MTRTYGALAYAGDRWVLSGLEPHVTIKLKAIFSKLPQASGGPFELPDDTLTAADLHWFMQRYPLAAPDAVIGDLVRRREEHEAMQNELARILATDYVPPLLPGLKPGQVLRQYQAQAVEMLRVTRGLLLGDEVGLGKTYIGAAACMLPGALPAVVVCEAHLQKQWCRVIEAFTTLTTHAVRGTKPYPLPPADVRVFRYSQLAGWADMFEVMGVGLVEYDEVQQLRHGAGTKDDPVQKGVAAMRLSEAARMRLGLTATPIYNYGSEIFNVLSFISPGTLGDQGSFVREWCSGGHVKDAKALGTFLREQRAFLRRTKGDVGQQMPPVNRIIDFVDYNSVELRSIDDYAHDLAMKASTGQFKERGEATRMLDLRVRHATGVSKAKTVAATVRILVEGGAPVVLVGWHRDVYDIWMTELADLKPLLYTGSESGAGKDRTAQAFMNGESDLLILSLRSGAGLDGLQHRCSTMVFGELDWSPGIHHQCIGRLDREGQKEPVTAIFLVVDDGSDPSMMEVLGLKASQAAGIVDPTLGVQKTHSDGEGMKRLVRQYLAKRPARSSAA